MNWSALTKKQQQMVVVTVILAIAQVFILIHFISGRSVSNAGGQSPKEELEALQGKIDDARMVIARAEIVTETLQETVQKLDDLSVHTPTVSDRYAWAYEYISLRSVKAGVELDSLEEINYVSDADKKAEDHNYEIRLSTQCNYNQLVEFLWRIEQGNPLVRVKDVDISMLPDSPEQHQVRIVLQWPSSLQIERGSI
ncbi:hypothetical protein [Tichowtungia aerotolerans]|uniref:Uncharacterized protein n=1 Tax=Tichowtungia aerotolerans TaxID=2697043 RepID=A0A6P1MFN6_9BACT|nr:hypothetical protein [Tichowtungia aerotolerans]QHI70828.1 hypothetical protein GT409_15725 [Tichowtungia aerotolerans]